jgi:hypothetical protein
MQLLLSTLRRTAKPTAIYMIVFPVRNMKIL